jgi:hypothetical protein
MTQEELKLQARFAHEEAQAALQMKTHLLRAIEEIEAARLVKRTRLRSGQTVETQAEAILADAITGANIQLFSALGSADVLRDLRMKRFHQAERDLGGKPVDDDEDSTALEPEVVS